MKKAFIIFISFFVIAVKLFSVEVENQVKEIEKIVDEINNNLENYELTYQCPVEIFYIDDVSLNIYKDKESKILIKMVLVFGDEMGTDITEYYYNDGNLILVLDRSTRYNVPFFVTKEVAEEAGQEEYLDESKFKIETNKYYINENKIIKWIDEKGHNIPLDLLNIDNLQSRVFYAIKEMEEMASR